MNSECKSDLLLRARNGNASEAELLALDAHLSLCASCRLTREIGRDFDAVGAAEPGDAARIARMAAAAQRAMQVQRVTPRLPPRPARLRPAWAVALAAILLGGLATAAGVLSTRDEGQPVAPTPASLGSELGVASAAGRLVASGAAPAETAAEPPATDPGNAIERPQAGAGAKARAAGGASTLYRAANEARRSGDRARAVRLYRELQRDYPGSPEAKLSRVSLGGLLLDDGSAAQAAEQFEAYASAPGGQRLGAEALYGKARALMSLGRRVEEIRTWQRLLREYPDSPYAAHARRRLAELR